MDKEEEEDLMIKKEKINNSHFYMSPMQNFIFSLKLLIKSERSLQYMFIINYLLSLQYYILVTFIPLYFSSQHGFSDLISGLIFGGFGVVIGISSIYLSSILQLINCKRGLMYSSLLGIFGFLLMIANSTYLSLAAVLIVHSISCSLSWPYIEYGIKTYSNPEIRNVSSSCFFMSNYLAGITTGVCIDFIWIYFEDKTIMYLLIYIIGIFVLIIALFFIYLCRNVTYVAEDNIKTNGIIKKKKFWRYFLMVFLLILLRSACFGHLDATLPKYMVKVSDDYAHFGAMLAVHSVTMLSGVFWLTALTYSFSSYNLIVTGGFIGAIGCSILMFVTEIWGFILFVIAISIGESIWVPRLLDYTYSIAPEGEEGVYLAMSNSPFYFGMIITGASSGAMLDKYCSGQDLSNCNAIWSIIFYTSFSIPIMLLFLKRFINQSNDKNDNDDMVCCFDKDKYNLD